MSEHDPLADLPLETRFAAVLAMNELDKLTHLEAINMCKFYAKQLLAQRFYYERLIKHRWFKP